MDLCRCSTTLIIKTRYNICGKICLNSGKYNNIINTFNNNNNNNDNLVGPTLPPHKM